MGEKYIEINLRNKHEVFNADKTFKEATGRLEKAIMKIYLSGY